MSVLVSISFAPILLTVSAAPVYETSKPMTLGELMKASPLGCVGMFMMGGIFSAIFGMSPIYGTELNMSVTDISLFVSSIYVGGMFFQYPIGYASDRVGRRSLIVWTTAFGAIVCFVGPMLSTSFIALLVVGFLVGGIANPLYSLLIAYTNDFLEHEDMAAASSGLIFLTGVSAIFGPLILGWMMSNLGPDSFFWFIGVQMAVVSLFAVYRSTQRATVAVEDQTAYATVLPQASPVAVEVAQEVAIEMATEEEEELENVK
jgi:MFS family permease